VGSTYSSRRGHRALIEHFDGAAWHLTTIPGAPEYLNAVAAVSPDDVWVVGDDPSYVSAPVIEHFNGMNWSTVAQSVQSDGTLDAITALSPDDVWATGSHNLDTLIEHFDGHTWTVVPSPGGSSGNIQSALLGISALSSHDIWAAGYTGDNGDATLVDHWNGTKWSLVPSPTPGLATLAAISGETGGPMFAVGSRFNNASAHWMSFGIESS
jgi:hypothetical protein